MHNAIAGLVATPRALVPSLALAAMLGGAPLAGAQVNDDATAVWSVEHATSVQVFDRGHDTHAAGTVAVTVGDIRDVPWATATTRLAFARGFGRIDGAERWRYLDDRCDVALAVSVDPLGLRATVVERSEVFGTEPGTERVVVLDTANGAVLVESERVLPAIDPRSTSSVDTLIHSNDGSVLYRLDFFGGGSTAMLRLEALDPTTTQVLWSVERPGMNPFEYYSTGSGDSLAVSPDGSILYVSIELPDVQNPFQRRDTKLLALSATDGSELWTASYATPNTTDRISSPMPTADSSGVCIATHVLPQPATLGPLRRLSAVDGSELWATPTDFTTWTWKISPDGSVVVVGGYVGNGSFPNGTDLALQAFDVASGASLWSITSIQANTTDEPIELAFAPDGSRLFAHISRRPLTFASTNSSQIASVDAATGGDLLLTDLSSPNDEFPTDHWMDAVALPGGGSQALIGQTRINISSDVGVGHDKRAAVDAAGNIIFELLANDTTDQDSDCIGRVWLAPDGSNVVIWKSAIDERSNIVALDMERRRTSDGALLVSLQIPKMGSVLSSEQFAAEVSPDGQLVAVQRVISTSPYLRALSFFEIDTGLLIHERLQFNNSSIARVCWSADSTRLAWALSGGLAQFGVIDVIQGQDLWSDSIAAITPFYGFVVPRGLTLDPNGQTFVCLFHESATFQDEINEYILICRDGTSGQPKWRLDYSAEGSRWQDPTLRSTSGEPASLDFGARTVGATTSPDGSIVYTADVFLHPLRAVARVAATSAIDGDLLWSRGTTIGPGEGARLVSLVTSADGRYVHVLCEGRGDVSTDPLRAYVATWDAATGAPLWQRFLEDELVVARRLVSLGVGGRIAILGTSADQTGEPVGGSLVVLEASSGTELFRAAESAARGEWLDVTFDVDGRFYTVGASTGGLLGVDGVLTRRDAASFQMGPHAASLSNGARAEVVLDLHPALAGDAYLVLGSATGASPGTPVGGGLVLPLVVDAYTDFTLFGANSQFLPNSFGLLDEHGDAQCAIAVPPGTAPSLAGLTFCYAALVIDPVTGDATGVTQAVVLTLVP